MGMKKPEYLAKAEREVKKIWDILRDKKIVRFKLSMKLYRDGLREPTTISMQGERSPDGSWNTFFPTNQNSRVLQSPDALKGKLASIEERVREYIAENELDAEWKELEASLEEALKSRFTLDDLEYRSELPIHAITAYGYEAHFYAPMMATAYFIKGTEALTKNDLSRASYCVNRGNYWSRPGNFLPNPNDRFTERARTGGLGKDFRREPAKDKVAELLKDLAPPEGWTSTTAAIVAVTVELTNEYSSFVEECDLKTDNLPRTIKGWIKADPKRFSHPIKSKT